MSADNDSDERDAAAARSAAYYRVSAGAALVCAIGSAILGALALGQGDTGRVFVGMGFVLIALSIVMAALTVACVQMVGLMRARAGHLSRAGRRPNNPR